MDPRVRPGTDPSTVTGAEQGAGQRGGLVGAEVRPAFEDRGRGLDPGVSAMAWIRATDSPRSVKPSTRRSARPSRCWTVRFDRVVDAGIRRQRGKEGGNSGGDADRGQE
jgi:hypothetical protein